GCDAWTGRSRRTHPIDGEFPVWSDANRCADAGDRLSGSDSCRADRVLHTRTPRNQGGSAGRAQVRVATEKGEAALKNIVFVGLLILTAPALISGQMS